MQSGIIVRKLRSERQQLCWQLCKQSDRHARNFSVGRGGIWQVCKEKENGTVRNVWEGLEKKGDWGEWHPWEKINCVLFYFAPHMNTHAYTHRTAWHGDSLLCWNFWLLVGWRMYIVASKLNSGFTFFLMEPQDVKKLLSGEVDIHRSCNNCTTWE